ADAGDARAVAAIERAADALAVALGSIVNVLDIPTIVFGGHLAALGPRLVAAVQDRLTVRVLHSTWVAPRVIAGSADPSAAATGAAYVLLERLLADPAALLPITASAPAG
ncbi:MAG: ROK family protein, partial [Nostocoides sp.]